MPSANLLVVTDDIGRIEGYRQSPESELIFPEHISEYLEGDDRLVHDGEEYVLDEKGNLVHLGVELPKTATLGHGVLIGSGVTFGQHLQEVRHWGNLIHPASFELGSGEISIDDRVLLMGSNLHEGVRLYHHAVIIGTSVGRNTIVGNNSVTREGSYLSGGVFIGSDVNIGEKVEVSAEVKIGNNVQIDDNNKLYPGIAIGHDSIVKTLPVPLEVDVPSNALAAPN